MIALIQFVVHDEVPADGAGIGAELHVARPPLLVRSWRANRSKGKILLLRQSRGMTYPCLLIFSEAEAKPNRGIDRAATEVAVRQSAIDLREHDPGVGIKFLRKLPIGDKGNGVERPVAVCERRGVGAVDECTKNGLVVMIIGASHIQIFQRARATALQAMSSLRPVLKSILTIGQRSGTPTLLCISIRQQIR